MLFIRNFPIYTKKGNIKYFVYITCACTLTIFILCLNSRFKIHLILINKSDKDNTLPAVDVTYGEKNAGLYHSCNLYRNEGKRHVIVGPLHRTAKAVVLHWCQWRGDWSTGGFFCFSLHEHVNWTICCSIMQ